MRTFKLEGGAAVGVDQDSNSFFILTNEFICSPLIHQFTCEDKLFKPDI